MTTLYITAGDARIGAIDSDTVSSFLVGDKSASIDDVINCWAIETRRNPFGQLAMLLSFSPSICDKVFALANGIQTVPEETYQQIHLDGVTYDITNQLATGEDELTLTLRRFTRKPAMSVSGENEHLLTQFIRDVMEGTVKQNIESLVPSVPAPAPSVAEPAKRKVPTPPPAPPASNVQVSVHEYPSLSALFTGKTPDVKLHKQPQAVDDDPAVAGMAGVRRFLFANIR